MPAAMKQMPRWAPWLLLPCSWACSDARLLDGFAEGQTRIRVLPEAFIGDVPCLRDTPGALQFYTVQLELLDPGAGADAGRDISSSPPVPCDRAVIFPAIGGRLYAADILGFDVEEAAVATSPSRWSAACGRGGGSPPDAGLDPLAPTEAVPGVTVPLRGCTSFGAPSSMASRLAVDVQSALGALRCGNAPGEVAFLEGDLEGARRRVACNEPLVFDISAPGRFHTLVLTGFELLADAGAPSDAAPPIPPLLPADAGADAGGDAEPSDAGAPAEPLDAGSNPDGGFNGGASPEPPSRARWRTQCVGRSAGGVTRIATCDPFAPLNP